MKKNLCIIVYKVILLKLFLFYILSCFCEQCNRTQIKFVCPGYWYCLFFLVFSECRILFLFYILSCYCEQCDRTLIKFVCPGCWYCLFFYWYFPNAERWSYICDFHMYMCDEEAFSKKFKKLLNSAT